jgi:hypothetical protein
MNVLNEQQPQSAPQILVPIDEDSDTSEYALVDGDDSEDLDHS